MNRPLVVIFSAVALDAVGMGLILPILPRLLEEVTHGPNIAPYIGILTALYAAMQFTFAPVLGALSDRLGRRPVLLVSLVGATVSYVIMAFAPTLLLMMVGRGIAGLTSANISVATAYITDISPEETRAKRFGIFNAMFGLGFVFGPVLGGMLGDYWLQLPLLAAAALNSTNLVLALFILPESHAPDKAAFDIGVLNPLRSLRWALSSPSIASIAATFFVLSGAGEVYGTCWALWGHDVFGWNGFWIGLSLGLYGVFQTFTQAFLSGPAAHLLGERAAVLTGIVIASFALTVLAFAEQSWIVFAIMPVMALAGIGTPALQSLASRLADKEQKGQFQGVLASALGLASVIAPLFFSSAYFLSSSWWPGAVWLEALVINIMAVPLVVSMKFFNG